MIKFPIKNIRNSFYIVLFSLLDMISSFDFFIEEVSIVEESVLNNAVKTV